MAVMAVLVSKFQAINSSAVVTAKKASLKLWSSKETSNFAHVQVQVLGLDAPCCAAGRRDLCSTIIMEASARLASDLRCQI